MLIFSQGTAGRVLVFFNPEGKVCFTNAQTVEGNSRIVWTNQCTNMRDASENLRRGLFDPVFLKWLAKREKSESGKC